MIQGHLFATPLAVGLERAMDSPVASPSDPATSKEAAAQITASGKREGQQLAALALVRKYPGCTSLELARKGGTLDRYILARRLPEVAHGGLIYQGETKQCCVSGNKAVTWWPR